MPRNPRQAAAVRQSSQGLHPGRVQARHVLDHVHVSKDGEGGREGWRGGERLHPSGHVYRYREGGSKKRRKDRTYLPSLALFFSLLLLSLPPSLHPFPFCRWFPGLLKNEMNQGVGKSLTWVLTAQCGQMIGEEGGREGESEGELVKRELMSIHIYNRHALLWLRVGQLGSSSLRLALQHTGTSPPSLPPSLPPLHSPDSFQKPQTAAAIGGLAFRWEYLDRNKFYFWCTMFTLGTFSASSPAPSLLSLFIFPSSLPPSLPPSRPRQRAHSSLRGLAGRALPLRAALCDDGRCL